MIGRFEQAIAEARAQVAAQIDGADGYIVFGAGQTGRLAANALRATGKPLVFADETPAKQGTVLDGMDILSPEDAAARLGGGALLVCAVYSPHVSSAALGRRLSERTGLPAISFLRLGLLYPDALLPYYSFQRPEALLAEAAEYEWLRNRLEDEASRGLLDVQLRFRLTFDNEALPEPLGMSFDPMASELPADVTFVDCGAFDGDTVRAFLAATGGRCAGVVAFEPDSRNFERLQAFVDGLDDELRGKCDLRNQGVWKETTTLRFRSIGSQGSSLNEDGDIAVPVASLDDAGLPAGPLFVKFDVEGAESEALDGARRLIAERRPVLAVSAYHAPQDLWSLARRIDDLHPSARLCLVAHGHDGADLTLYALP